MPNPTGLPYVAQGWTDGSAPALSAADLTKIDNALVSLSQGAVGSTTQPNTTYTLALVDAGSVIEMSSASAVSLTIPNDSAVNFPIGTTIEIFQFGAGQVTTLAASGVTLRSPFGKIVTAGQYASVTLRKRAANDWCLEGDLS
jgi:hypothetical protein